MPTEESPENVARLVELIEEICLEKETVLGTNLASEIKVRFPDLNLKLQFGGLRRFIQDHCSDRVVYVRAQGGDGVYAHLSKAGTKAPSESKPTSTPTAWATFVDPNVHSQLAVEPVSGSLHVYVASGKPEEKLIPVRKISIEEHRVIAKEFVPLIPIASQSPFESALSEDAFWPKWTAAFKTLTDREIYTKWMKWRYEKIVGLFEERLRSAGLSDDAVTSAISELQKSKQVKLASTKSTAAMVSTTPRGSLDYSLLRELAHSVINSMGDGDIRRIWLPLGAVADALQRKK